MSITQDARLQPDNAVTAAAPLPAAAAPFAAAYLWHLGDGYDLLQSVLMAAAVVSALAFALAAWLASSRKRQAARSEWM